MSAATDSQNPNASSTPDRTSIPEETRHRNGWADGRIVAVEGLDWAGIQLREAEEKLAENRRLHEAEVAELQEKIAAAEVRAATANEPHCDRIRFMTDRIRGFVTFSRDELLKGQRSGAKSRTFPGGLKVAWRTTPERWSALASPAAEELLLRWAEGVQRNMDAADPPLVEYPPVLRMKNVMAFAKALTGDVGPAERIAYVPVGMEYTPESETLTITTPATAKESK